jgi:signal transduction histidine kinase
MNDGPECVIAGALAIRLRESREDLTRQWLDRINDRVSLVPDRIFPSEELLDHVPVLIDGIASYIESPAAEVSADAPVVAKAMELGALRHSQGFDAYEILKEYEILGGILFTFFIRAVDTIEGPCERGDLMACAARLFRAVTIIQQATMTDFLRLAGEQIGERENRLRAFNRMVSHEIKNRIGAVIGASAVLQETPEIPEADRSKFVEIIARNAREMANTVEAILELSQLERDARQHRHVRLTQAIKEAVRQVREAARQANVEIRVAEIPADIEVDAAVVELCVTNYLSNAIKYSDRSRPAFAEVTADVEVDKSGQREIVVRVKDNGRGVPPSKRERLYERFYRAHEDSKIEGTGLGLSIVRDTAESHGGRSWAEFPETGSTFILALPLRREEDPEPAP